MGTLKICKELVKVLENKQIQVELYSIENFKYFDILKFDTLIIGASIRYGKHKSSITKFIIENKAVLKKINTAFFSVNLVARKKEKSFVHTNPYLIKFLKNVNWAPDIVDVFAGKLDYGKYSFIDKMMIKLIMLMTQGPTKSSVTIEYTDWNRVKEFGKRVRTLNLTKKLIS